MNEHDIDLSDDAVISRLRSALDEVHAAPAAAPIDPLVRMITPVPAPSASPRRWIAIAAAAALVVAGVVAIAANRGKDAPSAVTEASVAPTSTFSSTTAPSVVADANWYVLDLPGFTAQPETTEVCCPPMPAPGPTTVVAWGDVTGIEHGVLMLRSKPAISGEPTLSYTWAGMTDARAQQLIAEVVPGSGLPYVLPDDTMQFLGSGFADIGNLRTQDWASSDGRASIAVGDYRGQLNLLTFGPFTVISIAGQQGYRVHKTSGSDSVVWQTPNGQWATLSIGGDLAGREDEIIAAVVPAPEAAGPTTTTAATTTGPPASAVTLTGPALIIDSGNGPMLASGYRESLPPQGGDVPIDGFDWSMVDGEQTSGGTTWTDTQFTLTGTWDGTTFHLTQPPAPYVPPSLPAPQMTPGCTLETMAPMLDALGTLDMSSLRITSTSSWNYDGHCGVKISALFDTPALRAAAAKVGDDVTLEFVFNPAIG
ncbi:MAG: hypothetical protein RJA49_1235 [Actinomycetota bacterium]